MYWMGKIFHRGDEPEKKILYGNYWIVKANIEVNHNRNNDGNSVKIELLLLFKAKGHGFEFQKLQSYIG